MPYHKFARKILRGYVRDFTSFGNVLVLLLLLCLMIDDIRLLILIIIWLGVVEVTTILIKLISFKHRPQKEKYSNIIEKIWSSSFPSSHVARGTFVYLVLYSFSHHKSILFLLLILIVAATRVLMGKHFVVDTIVGFAIGVFYYFLAVTFVI